MTRAGGHERRYGRCECGSVASGPAGLCKSCTYGICTQCGGKADGPAGLCKSCTYGKCTICGNKARSPTGLCFCCRYGACKICGNKANGPAGLCTSCTYGPCQTCKGKANGPAGLCQSCRYAGLRPCTVPGCSKLNGTRRGTVYRDLCDGHATRLRTHGDTFPDVPIGHKIPETWEQRPSVVYVAYDLLGTPLYIGSSFGDGTQRFAWHRKFQPWASEIASFKIHSEHPTRGEAFVAEASLIQEWRAMFKLYNKIGAAV